jgi:hypothetical protein
MAKSKRPAPRPQSTSGGGGPRRLGGTANTPGTPSASAQRRMARKRQTRSRQYGWTAVVVVIVVVLVIVLTNVLGSKPTNDTAGRNPGPASASIIKTLTTIPASVFNSVGTDGQPAAFVKTAKQTFVGTTTKPRLIYVGAEYCPYCGVMRWALIAGLARFGTFTGIKTMTSSSTDTPSSVPTFSFYKSSYTSKYLTFTPYEIEDRDENPFETPPQLVANLAIKFSNTPFSEAASQAGSISFPSLNVASQYVSAGVTTTLADLASLLENGGPGRAAIAQGIADPSSSIGQGISGAVFIAQANYIDAAVCLTNGMQPSSVCSSSGVQAAAKALKSQKAVS